MNPIAQEFLILASYTGGAIPMLMAFVVPYIRRAISPSTWITLCVFVAVHAVSFIQYLIASHQENPSALEALWIPIPLGVFLFFITSFCVVAHSFPLQRADHHEGEQGEDTKPDNVPS